MSAQFQYEHSDLNCFWEQKQKNNPDEWMMIIFDRIEYALWHLHAKYASVLIHAELNIEIDLSCFQLVRHVIFWFSRSWIQASILCVVCTFSFICWSLSVGISRSRYDHHRGSSLTIVHFRLCHWLNWNVDINRFRAVDERERERKKGKWRDSRRALLWCTNFYLRSNVSITARPVINRC